MKKVLILVGIVSSFLFSSLMYATPFNDNVFMDGSGNGSVAVSNTAVDSSKEIKEKDSSQNKRNNSSQRELSIEKLIQQEIIYKIRGGTYRVW